MTIKADKFKDRFAWAVTILSPGETDHLLEVGCGAGLLVERVAPLITRGKINAVDRSASMVQLAVKRNDVFVKNGIVEFGKADYDSDLFPNHSFDKLIAFNVSDFWSKPGRTLTAVRKHLKPNGRLYLFHQPPFNKTEAMAEVAATLEKSLGEPESAKFVFRPQNYVPVDAEKGATLLKLIGILEEDDDVQNVYSNFDMSDEDLAKAQA